MSFYENPFNEDFIGAVVLSDRQYTIDFKCPRNTGRGDEVVYSWKPGPYNLSGNDSDGNSSANLSITFSTNALGPNGLPFTNWTTLNFSATTGAISTSAVKPAEVVASLNKSTTFTSYFSASLQYNNPTNPLASPIVIQQLLPSSQFKFYISNGKAEEQIKFNARVGVSELPTYLDRHTMVNCTTFTDCANILVGLNPYNSTNTMGLHVDAGVITSATNAYGTSLALNPTIIQADYKLLKGKSGLFTFQKLTLDGASPPRVTKIIEYPAGATAGYLAKKIEYSYTSTNTQPDQITEQPYTLTSGDLVTPA